jgi:uncharacterized protein
VDLLPPDAPVPHRSLVFSAVVFYLGVAAVAVVWGLLDGRRALLFHPGSGPSLRLAFSLAAGLALAGVVIALSRFAEQRFDWARRLEAELAAVLAGLTTRDAVVLAATSALAEEALFRGAMVPTLGILGSSLLFGLAHFPTRRGLAPWPLFALGLGLVLGLMYVRLGDLLGPVVAHFTINVVNLRRLGRTGTDAR